MQQGLEDVVGQAGHEQVGLQIADAPGQQGRLCIRKNWPMATTMGTNRAARSERVTTAASRPIMVNCMRRVTVTATNPAS